MAKICVAFYNGLYNSADKSIMPAWYEVFLSGLKEYGNELLIFSIPKFRQEYGEIDDETKNNILDFNPDLYIAFNNVFYNLDFLDCVQIAYEADTPIYWNNLEELKQSKKLICIFGNGEADYLRKLGIHSDRINIITPFTGVHFNDNNNPSINISFIGTRFGINRKEEMGYIAEIDETFREDYFLCIQTILNNPNVDIGELRKIVKNKDIINYVDVSRILMMMSSEKRVRVLSSVVDLGLDLYGTDSWMYRYHFDTRLNMAYKNKKVYSLIHNEEIYNNSKIAINISHYQAKDSFSWRVLDIMASNACLVTDSWSGVKKTFPELNIPIYEDEHQARYVCKKLLEDDSTRKEIVDSCHTIIDKKYRFKHHLRELEDISGVNLGTKNRI